MFPPMPMPTMKISTPDITVAQPPNSAKPNNVRANRYSCISIPPLNALRCNSSVKCVCRKTGAARTFLSIRICAAQYLDMLLIVVDGGSHFFDIAVAVIHRCNAGHGSRDVVEDLLGQRGLTFRAAQASTRRSGPGHGACRARSQVAYRTGASPRRALMLKDTTISRCEKARWSDSGWP